MSATTTKVQSIIDENAVAVFSKSYCPYCRSAKKLLSDSGANFYVIELDQVGMYIPSLLLPTSTFTSATLELEMVHLLRFEANTNSIVRRWFSDPGRARRIDGPDHGAQHLHRTEAHWWKLGFAGQEGRFAYSAQGCGCHLTRCAV